MTEDFFITTEVRALSIKQPYAALMLPPVCKVETRTWPTDYRGWVMICTSSVPFRIWQQIPISGDRQLQRMDRAMEQLDERVIDSCGEAIAVGRLVDCRPMTHADQDRCYVRFKPGMYCHIFEDVMPIHRFPWKGSLGYTEMHEESKQKIKLK